MSASTMGERQSILNDAALLVQEAKQSAGFACGRIAIAKDSGNKRFLDDALERATEAKDRAETALKLLQRIGATLPVPEAVKQAQEAKRFDLDALTALDTPSSRALLDMLRQVQELAERVDAERGRAVGDDIPLLPGESRGTDYAESVSLLVLKLDTELNGPMAARGRE